MDFMFAGANKSTTPKHPGRDRPAVPARAERAPVALNEKSSAVGPQAQRNRLLVLIVVALSALFSGPGCGNSSTPSTESEPDSTSQPTTAEKILERMFATYRECDSYADNGLYRERWVLRRDGVIQEPPPQMVSVSFERPARLRVTRRRPGAEGNIAEEVTLTSTGSRIYHTLPQYPRQVLETVAPIALAADTFAAAPQVAGGLLFLPLEDSFPQLDLLLSDEPQQDAISAGAAPTLLDDARLGERPCYRVTVVTDAGQRVYWIDQESHLLRRLDLPPGNVRQAIDLHDELQDFQRWIELADAVVNQELPETAFQVDVPESAVIVRKWVSGFPGPAPDGAEVDPEELRLHEALMAQYEASLAEAATAGQELHVEVASPEIAARSEPQTMRLTEKWHVEGVTSPGDVIVVEAPPGPRIFAIDEGTSVVEVDWDGRLIQRHAIPDLEGESVSFLRTFAGEDGQRWFAVSGPGRRRAHLFDAAWQHLWSFPQEENPGIGDVVFVPFGEDATPQLAVGFWDDVGVHGVSLAGERVWVERSLQQVMALVLAPGEGQNPVVWTAHGREVIGRVGKDGSLPPIYTTGRMIVDLAAADLDGDGKAEMCGIAFLDLGAYDAVGLDATGAELWSYSLPKGEFRVPTRRIAAATGDKLGGWILPAADGSIHFLSADGKLVDRFHYGQAFTGVALAQREQEVLLIVASPDRLVAWRVEPE